MPANQLPQPETTASTGGTVHNARHRTCSGLKLCYHLAISYFLYLFLVPVAAALLLRLSRHCGPDDDLAALARCAPTASPPLTTAIMVLAAVLATAFLTRRRPAVYLLDFACYKPGPDLVVTRETFIRQVAAGGTVTHGNLLFQQKVIDRSGLGEETYLPKALLNSPPNACVAEARAEAEAVMFGAVDKVIAQTAGVRARDIGIVVVNCGLFCPMPSLSAMIVNRYKLRENVATYNLGGMGCSAGLISIDLAKQLLQVHRNTYALVVSMEILSLNGYWGNNRSMLMSNCLFRMGGAAVLLTNRSSDRRRAKYQLVHTVLTHHGADGRAFRCAFQEEDETGRVGVALSKDLMAVAGEALKANITTLGPLVLPLSEQILFLASLVGRKVFGVRSYVPDFKMAFEHFCIHAGGRAVLDTVEKNLELSPWHMEPSRMTLYRWGNTSSSSLWYELAYTEAQGRVRRGHRVWQIAFGSGFKCNSAVWRALWTIDPAEEEDGGNPWLEEIHRFPVEVP